MVIRASPRHAAPTEERVNLWERRVAAMDDALRGGLLPPLPQSGEVLAAGRAWEQALQGFACPKGLSVGVRLSASRVRFAGLRPPLTRPASPAPESSAPPQNSKEPELSYGH